MKAWKFTVIHHPARRALGISQNEYSVYDLMYKTQTHPEMNVGGWCERSYRQIAVDLGIGSATVFEIIERGVSWGFVDVNPANPDQKKTLPSFYDVAYLEEAELESVQIHSVRKPNDVRKPNTTVRKPNTERSETERNRSETEHYINNLSISVVNDKEKGDTRIIDEAVEIVEFFNSSAGRKVSTAVKGRGCENVGWVAQLLRKGYTRDEIQDMIIFKVWEWRGNPKMEKHLEPVTIFKRHGATYIQQAIEARDNPDFLKVLQRSRDAEQKTPGKIPGDGSITRGVAERLANW